LIVFDDVPNLSRRLARHALRLSHEPPAKMTGRTRSTPNLQRQAIAENHGNEPESVASRGDEISSRRIVDVTQLTDHNLVRPTRPLLDFLDDHSMDSAEIEDGASLGQQNFLGSGFVLLDAEIQSGHSIRKFLDQGRATPMMKRPVMTVVQCLCF
jgi:hypothetical protein